MMETLKFSVNTPSSTTLMPIVFPRGNYALLPRLISSPGSPEQMKNKTRPPSPFSILSNVTRQTVPHTIPSAVAKVGLLDDGFEDLEIDLGAGELLPTSAVPRGHDQGEQTDQDGAGVVHVAGADGQGGRHAHRHAEDDDVQDGEPVGEVAEPSQSEVARGQDAAAAAQEQDPLRHDVGDVQVQDGSGNDGVKGRSRGQVEKTVKTHEEEGRDCGANREVEPGVDV